MLDYGQLVKLRNGMHVRLWDMGSSVTYVTVYLNEQDSVTQSYRCRADAERRFYRIVDNMGLPPEEDAVPMAVLREVDAFEDFIKSIDPTRFFLPGWKP